MVNFDNFIWVEPYYEENISIVYVTTQGKINYSVSLYVKGGFLQVTKLIQQ